MANVFILYDININFYDSATTYVDTAQCYIASSAENGLTSIEVIIEVIFSHSL
jgi:hypothetical protein